MNADIGRRTGCISLHSSQIRTRLNKSPYSPETKRSIIRSIHFEHISKSIPGCDQASSDASSLKI